MFILNISVDYKSYAKSTTLEDTTYGKSLMWCKHIREHITVPCGTPDTASISPFSIYVTHA